MAESVLEVVFKGVDQSLSSTANGIGSAFGRVGGAIKTGLAVGITAVAGIGAATLGLGAKLVGLGSDAEEMMGKFNVVFANTGGAVTDQLTAFANEVGRSKFELMGMASTFGDTLKPMGFTEQAAADFSVQLSKLAVDLGSFNNMETDEAMRRLQGTLIGSHENALAFGVIINENTLAAKLQEMGLDDLTGAALEQAKVQARMALLMEGTTDAQGDALRTSTSWANQMRALKSRLTDVATELGGKLLPVLSPLLQGIGTLAERLIPKAVAVFDRLVPIVSVISGAFRNLFAAIEFGRDPADALAGFFLQLASLLPLSETQFEDLGTRIFEVKDRIIEIKDQVVAFLAPIVQWVQDNIMLKDVLIALAVVLGGIVLSAIVSIATALAPVVLGIAALIGIVALLRTAWEQNWGGIQEKTAALWAFLQPILQNLIAWLQTNIPIALEFLKNVWETVLLPAIQAVWTWLETVLMPFIMGVLVPWLQENIPAAIQVLTDFWNNTLLPVLQGVWEFLTVRMMPIWEALSEFFSVAFTLALTALTGIWQNVLLPALTTVWEFIKDKLGPVFQWLKDSLIEPTSAAFETLSGMIADVATWISQVADELRQIELPDWMTPGSPTPWEIGLKGVRNQLQSLYQRELPGLQANLQGFNQSGATNQRTVNNNQTFNWSVNTASFNPESAGRAAAAFATGGI